MFAVIVLKDEDHYLMELGHEMRLKAYSSYLNRQGFDSIRYHGEAIRYLEGETEEPPVLWHEAMDLLKGDLE